MAGPATLGGHLAWWTLSHLIPTTPGDPVLPAGLRGTRSGLLVYPLSQAAQLPAIRAHNGALYSGAPTPTPKGQRAQRLGGQPPALSVHSRQGAERRGVRASQLEMREGFPRGPLRSCTPGSARDHPQPLEACSPPWEGLSHGVSQIC